MMQPPRQISAISPKSSFQPYSSLRLGHQREALGVGADLRAVQRVAHRLDQRLPASPRSGTAGPRSCFDAATRSSLSALTKRAKTASAIVGAGTPMSSALTLVHLPGALLARGVEDDVDQEACAGWPGPAAAGCRR